MEALLPLVILLPLLGSALVGLGGFLAPGFRKNESLVGLIATAMVAIPFFIIAAAFFQFDGTPIQISLFSWMQAGDLNISFSYEIDQLSLLMGMIVTGVGSLIHIYSIGYMHGDGGYYKFFGYLNLFIFAMNNLIFGDNFVVMFLGWEGVGLCSYLLIGFWYKDMPKAIAAQKAFIANRIGDFAMIIAMIMVFNLIGSLNFSDLNAAVADGSLGDNAMWISLLIFIAATGKSAQIPLFVWLPDAMAGPTPVSALIHAATMVTSGIYLVARLNPVFSASPEVMTIIVIVAALTAVVAALIAIAQNDIKKVLAYSTVSQLGFMFMALGAGAYTAAIFHVMTHAFFKACLFLGSGSVIHAMEHMHTVEDPQDIRTMGGLRKYMPATSTTFWISTLAISGIIPLAGFFSKDEILTSLFLFDESAFSIYKIVWFVATLTAVLTAVYMTRLTMLTFEGKERFPDTKHPHESPASMTIPLWILAALAVVGGFLGLPYLIGHGEFHLLNHWLEPVITNNPAIEENASFGKEIFLILLSTLLAIGAVFFTRNLYRKHGLAADAKVKKAFGGLFRVMEGKFFLDELYNAILIKPFMSIGNRALSWFDNNIVDGAVNGSGTVVANIGESFRKLQSGLISNYLLIITTGVVAMLGYLIFG
ncbi:MAG: NADH-quinone oxidoreductase subunit L [Bacteroidia bacterium]|nr:NADH-quinone oxidoreductase subunit L [Bacteroidia bacterium]